MAGKLDSALVNVGLRRPSDGNFTQPLTFKTWQSWAALAVAVAIVVVLNLIWR